MLNTNYPVSFTSRTPVIRDADRVCRTIKTEFNAVSPSMLIERLKYGENEDNFLSKFNGKFRDLFFKKDEELRFCREFVDFKRGKRYEILNLIKRSKVMNCAENAEAARIAALLNGAKDVNCFAMFSYNEKTNKITNLDHLVAVLNYELPEYCNFYGSYYQRVLKEDLLKLPKKSIVIDPWIGFADYVDNAVTKFKHEYQKLFDIKTDEKVRFVPQKFPELSENDLLMIKEAFPNLLIKKLNLNG